MKFKNPNVQAGVQKIGKIQDRLAAGKFKPANEQKIADRLTGLQTKYTPRIDNKIAKIDNRLPKIQGRIDSGNFPNAQARFDRVTKRRAALEALKNPYTVKTPETPAGPPTPQPRDYQKEINGIMQGLFPQISQTNAMGYIKDSLQPVYDWQQQEGSKALDRYYAARGLTRSGAEDSGNIRFDNELMGRFTDTALKLSQQDADRKQTAANRLQQILSDEADRAQTGEQNQFDNLYRTIELMTRQSPLGQGYDAAQSSADLTAQYGSEIAGLLQSMYARPGPTGGGGYVPNAQRPTGAAADIIQSQGDAATGSEFLGAAGNILAGIFGL